MTTIEIFHSFAAITLICGMISVLLPEGSLKKTASLVMGLILTLYWMNALSGWLNWSFPEDLPETALSSAAVSLDDRSAAVAAYERILSSCASHSSGVSVQVELDESGCISRLVLPEASSQEALALACQAVGAAPEVAVQSTAAR